MSYGPHHQLPRAWKSHKIQTLGCNKTEAAPISHHELGKSITGPENVKSYPTWSGCTFSMLQLTTTPKEQLEEPHCGKSNSERTKHVTITSRVVTLWSNHHNSPISVMAGFYCWNVTYCSSILQMPQFHSYCQHSYASIASTCFAEKSLKQEHFGQRIRTH